MDWSVHCTGAWREASSGETKRVRSQKATGTVARTLASPWGGWEQRNICVPKLTVAAVWPGTRVGERGGTRSSPESRRHAGTRGGSSREMET